MMITQRTLVKMNRIGRKALFAGKKKQEKNVKRKANEFLSLKKLNLYGKK